MKDMAKICKVALVQAEPVLFDKGAALVHEAARGAEEAFPRYKQRAFRLGREMGG